MAMPICPPTAPIPWWYCTPVEPLPVTPTRPTGFVLLADYDADFKYPLASSRIASMIETAPLEEGCSGCGPMLITNVNPDPDPDPDPEPVPESWAHYVYFIGEIYNDVMRVGYARVSRDSGQHQVLAYKDYLGYGGLHDGGVCTNNIDTIFVAGALFDNLHTLEALQISGENLITVGTWSGVVGTGFTGNWSITGLAAEGNTVFVLQDNYLSTGDLGRLYALTFTGTSFEEIASYALDATTRAGDQIIKVGDHIVVLHGNTLKVVAFDGSSLTLTDTLPVWEVSYTEAPTLSTDGVHVFFGGRENSGDIDSVVTYTINSSGQLTQDAIWANPRTDDDVEGARVGTAFGVVRNYGDVTEPAGIGVQMRISAYARNGNTLNTNRIFSTAVYSFNPWGFDPDKSILYVPMGLEYYQTTLDDDSWMNITTRPSPLKASGIFDLSKSFDFIEWGSSTGPFVIPDDDTNDESSFLENSIVVTGQEGTTYRAAVNINITHGYEGDLRVDLIAPDMQTVRILFATNIVDYPDSYLTSLQANFENPVPINGTWTIKVIDPWGGGNGTLNSWEIGVVPAILSRFFLLNIGGEDAYSRLEAGFITATEPLT